MGTTAYYPTAQGLLEVVCSDGAVTGLRWVERPAAFHQPTPLSDAAAQQVREYLDGQRRMFSLPVSVRGTAFQKRVWQALAQIPYGQTTSYGAIAARLDCPKACRAVGAAVGRNPLWLLIPCHRCVGKNGALTGYAGGLARKACLLALERSVCSGTGAEQENQQTE